MSGPRQKRYATLGFLGLTRSGAIWVVRLPARLLSEMEISNTSFKREPRNDQTSADQVR